MSLHSWDITLDIGSGGGAEPAAMWDSADLFDTFMEPCSLSSECILCGSWNRSKTSLKLFLSDQLPYLLSLGWPYTMLWPAEPEGSPLECSLEASMPVRLGQTEKDYRKPGLQYGNQIMKGKQPWKSDYPCERLLIFCPKASVVPLWFKSIWS